MRSPWTRSTRCRGSMRKDLADALVAASNAPGTGLARAALAIARIEYPKLDPEPYVGRLDAMGAAARTAIERHAEKIGDSSTLACIRALNSYLFDDLQFVGNRDRY